MRYTFYIILFIFLFLVSLMAVSQTVGSKGNFYAIRLKPHQDLKKELMAFAEKEKLKAAFIATCVGSLEEVTLRFANQTEGQTMKRHFEIVSLVGTLTNSSSHLHLSVSDSTGKTIGGHLLDGNLIYTTAEIVLRELTDLEFDRELDTTYGYKELVIKPRKRE